MNHIPNTFSLKAHIARLRASHPEFDEDEALLLDTLEGETTFSDAMSAIVESIREREAQADACKSRKAEVDKRRARHEGAVESLRGLALTLLQTAGLDNLRLDDGTMLRVSAVAPKPIITDAASVPQELCKIEPSLTAIRAYIAAGNDLPEGVGMSNGGVSLQIR